MTQPDLAVDDTAPLERQGPPLDPREVEAALLGDPSVDECVVLVRETDAAKQELVAYVVPGGPLSPARLQERLHALLPAAPLPVSFVPISSVPLTPEGWVDRPALARLEVIDADLVQRWEAQLRSVPEIQQVAVVAQDYEERIPPLHLSDLLPGWKSLGMAGVSQPVADPTPRLKVDEAGPKAPAISHGGPLRLEPGAPATLPAALQRAALQSPEKGVTYIESDGTENMQAYPVLLEEAQRVLAGLRKLGLRPQDKVIFQFSRNRNFITAFWGCVLGGFVPVPLAVAPTYKEVNGAVNKLHSAWRMLDRPAVLTEKALASEVRSVAGLLDLHGFRVETIDELLSGGADRLVHQAQPEDLALLMPTSGSTGKPKGVALSHYNLLSRTAGSIQLNGFSSQEVTLNWMPLDHVAGIIYFHIRDVFLGCQQIHAPTNLVLLDSLKWLDWIDRFRATVTFAPNFAYGLVNDRAEEISRRDWDLSSMRFVLNGAEAIVARTARRFLELLRAHGLKTTVMHPAWGMSETSSGVTYSDRLSLDSIKDEDSFVEVGRPIPGFSMRIVDDQNRVIEECAVGRLQVKGATVTAGYFNNAALNQEVFTEDGWFNTGDLGFLREGRLTITGREKDVIIVNSVNYYSHDIEAAVEEVEGVETSYTAACPVREPGTNTDRLAVFFHPASPDATNLVALLNQIRHQVASRVGINPSYLIPVQKEDIPKTSIGKIQRSQLSDEFKAGKFDAALKQVDLLSQNANTLPDWFYQKVWRRKEATTSGSRPLPGQYLVLMDQAGLGKTLCAELDRLGPSSVRVEAGADFVKLGRHRYQINPKNPDHYQRLLEALAKDGLRIDQVLHLWGYDSSARPVASLEDLEQAQERGVYSLLFLVQALDKVQGLEAPVNLCVVTSRAQPASPDEPVAYEKSPLSGLLKTIPQELPGLRCRHVDLESDGEQRNAGYLLRELSAPKSEPEVAYRKGQRLICRLVKADLLQQARNEIPLKHGGLYLITGGLGGIGTALAQFLVQQCQARLIVVGRTSLPPREEWEAQLQQETAVSRRLRSYLEIEASGAEFIYQAVDVCDLAGLAQAVSQAEARWQQPLTGVFHLAGVGDWEYQRTEMHRHWVTMETPETFGWMLRPKVYGTWTLAQLLKDRPRASFIAFSSLIAFFGGAMASAYAAASSFQDCFSHHLRNQESRQSHCIGWSVWGEVGMSRGQELVELTRSRGYQPIKTQQGMYSLMGALRHDQAHLMVGLDGANPRVRLHADGDSPRAKKLVAYLTTRPGETPVNSWQQLSVRDRFGTPSAIEFRAVAELPLTADGAIDRQRLSTVATSTQLTPNGQELPRTEVERRMASIWKEVLGVQSVGINDNFLQLGGDSLRATQVISRLGQSFSLELPLRSFLLECPTIAKASKVIEEMLIEELEELSDSEAHKLAAALFPKV